MKWARARAAPDWRRAARAAARRRRATAAGLEVTTASGGGRETLIRGTDCGRRDSPWTTRRRVVSETTAFYRTRLEEHLRGLGVTSLVVAGCNFPNCPRATLLDASCRDFPLALATDAVSQLEDRDLAQMADIGVALLDVDELRAALTPAPQTAG